MIIIYYNSYTATYGFSSHHIMYHTAMSEPQQPAVVIL
jgi:hypothetical protein